jgi:xanthine dehydrogenase molybdopterin-binding subunit B
MPGVVAFLSAKDIPGKNSFTPVGLVMIFEDEEVCNIYKNCIAVIKLEWITNVGKCDFTIF